MAETFGPALMAVRRWEGGLVDHPSDPGGITKWGISIRFLRGIGFDVNGDGIVNGQDIKDLSKDQMKALYMKHFWQPCHCDELPIGLDLAVFDCAVNQGVGRAIRLFQKAAGVKADGIIGSNTMGAAWATPPKVLLADFMARRAVHYSGLRNVVVFGLGWYRRLFDIHQRSLVLMG